MTSGMELLKCWTGRHSEPTFGDDRLRFRECENERTLDGAPIRSLASDWCVGPGFVLRLSLFFVVFLP